MKIFARVACAVLVLLVIAALGFYAGRRSAAQQPDVFTWLLWLDSQRGVYEVLQEEPSADQLNAARQRLLLGMGAAAEVLRTHPDAVQARFGDNSASIYELVERAEQHIKQDTDLGSRTGIVLDQENNVIAFITEGELKRIDNESVGGSVEGSPSADSAISAELQP